MKHKHEYESVYHPSPTAEVKALGIREAEIRRCKTCNKEIILVLTKDGWFPLLDDHKPDEHDILLA